MVAMGEGLRQRLGPMWPRLLPEARGRSCQGDAAAGGGRPRRISLSNPGALPKLCACMPGLVLFPLSLTVVAVALISQEAFYWVTVALTVYSVIYTTNLSVGCAIGAYRLRRDAAMDWHAKLQKMWAKSPETSEVMHIVVLPNYEEHEDMLLHTLEGLGRSAIARETMHVVLAMEEREGQAARAKAEGLIRKASHLFADLSATFHPANLPGDLVGKSSNSQWAYRQVLQRFAAKLSKMDPSQVFLTVGDADTLFHPQYFSALSYQAMCLPRGERAWSMWQPPILLMRNLFSSPAPTRVSGYTTILFELAGLANQQFSPHFSYSAYSTTLALASHRFVDGWDRDVIAEDHHMFCKCYFASIWDQLEVSETESGAAAAVKSRVQLRPVYLPAISFLVESEDGWVASLYARFEQARRHCQGVAELSYVCLQHMHLLMSENAGRLAWSTHARILSMVGKMAGIHIMPHIYAIATLMAGTMLVSEAIQWLTSHGIHEVFQALAERGIQGLLSLLNLGGLKWILCATFGPLPPIGMMMSAVTYLVILDTVEGRLTSDGSLSRKTMDGAATRAVIPSALAAPDVQGSAKGQNGLGWWGRIKLFLMVLSDYIGGASLFTMFAFGLIPASLAAWSMLRNNGAGFKYVVAGKPR